MMERPPGSSALVKPEEIRQTYWIPLEGRHKAGAWEVLDAGYGEKHRAYHTWTHIAGVLEKLWSLRGLSSRPDIIAMAAFWHDVVYRTQNPDGSPRPDHENVRDSAELFRHYALLPASDANAVYDLIMATADHMQAQAKTDYYPGFIKDFDLFLDLDLSSLASPWEEFTEHLERIRKEFFWAPGVVFYSAHLRILENFAMEDVQLYRTAECREKWHAAAKANLQRCILELAQKIDELSFVREEV